MIKAGLIAAGGLVGAACYFHGPHFWAHISALADYL